MSDVIRLPVGDTPPDDVLEAVKGKLDGVFILGWKDGAMTYSASTSEGKDLLWAVEKARQFILEQQRGY